MNIIKIKQNESPFMKWVKGRLSEKEKNSVNIAIVGETGSGKTYAALKLCQEIDSEFNDTRIVFSVEEVVKLLDANNSGLHRGSAVLLEETGVSAGSRDALTNTNKTLSYIYQTIRVKGYFLVLTLPNFTFLDKQVRELQHVLIETQSINYREKLCVLKPLFINVNQTTGQMYKKYLNYNLCGRIGKLKTLSVGLARKDLIKSYELRKDIYLNELRIKMEEKLITKEEKKKQKENAPAYSEAEITKYHNIKDMREQGNTWPVIATQLGTKSDNIRKWFSTFNINLV